MIDLYINVINDRRTTLMAHKEYVVAIFGLIRITKSNDNDTIIIQKERRGMESVDLTDEEMHNVKENGIKALCDITKYLLNERLNKLKEDMQNEVNNQNRRKIISEIKKERNLILKMYSKIERQ